MAPFNPQVNPVNPQEYLKFDSISQPMADTSRGISLKNLSELGDLPGIADKFIKNKATQEATEGVDAIRDIHTASLQAAVQPQQIIPQPAATPAGAKVATPSLMDSNASLDIPASVESGLERIGTLTAAREGGKINDTAYTAQLYALAKNLRSQYPNYRPYIDESISSMTGFNPANAYAKNLMEDLNQQRQGLNKERDRMISEVSKYHGYKTVDGTTATNMIDYIKNGGNLSNASQWVDSVAETEVKAKLNTARVTQKDQNAKERKDSAETGFAGITAGIVNNDFYSNAARNDLMSSQKIAERVAEEQMYPGTYSSTDMEAAGRMLNGRRSLMESKMWAEASKPIIDPATGKPAVDENGNQYSWYTLNGASKTKELIDTSLKPYDISVKAALDEKTGTATYASTHAQRVRQDMDNKIVSDPTNTAMLRLDWLNKNVPGPLMNSVITESLKADIDVKLQNWFVDKTLNMTAGPNWKIGQVQSTFKKDIEEARNGTTTGGPIGPNSKVPDRLAENINWLTKPEVDDATKMRIAKYYFSPEGRDVLGNFKEGYYDEKRNWIPGRQAVWETLTNKSVTDEIARISRMPGGGLIAKNYKDWMEQEFAQHMFQTPLQNLRERPQYGTFDKERGKLLYDSIHIGYENKEGKPQFILLDKNDKPLDPDYMGGSIKKPRQPVESQILNRYQDSLTKLNQGLNNMAEMERSLGGDVDSYIMDTLVNRFKIGFDKDVHGLPAKMAAAIAESSKPAKKLYAPDRPEGQPTTKIKGE